MKAHGFVKALLVFILIGTQLSCMSLSKPGDNFKIRAYEEKVLSNGLRVLLIRDDRLPTVSLMTLIKTGSQADMVGKEGVANLVGQLLNKGTTSRKSLQLAESLEQYGSSYSVSVGNDFSFIGMDGLSYHLDHILEDYAEILIHPSFKREELNREKRKITAYLKRKVDSPGSFASDLFRKFVYKDHPYGRRRMGTKKSVKAIKKKDINKFYLTYYRPTNAIMAVVGAFGDEIVAKLETAMVDWKNRPTKTTAISTPLAVKGLNVRLVGKSDLTQSQIRIGHLGIKRSDPDYLPLRVANTVLGGSFVSRLNKEIRIKRGLTYAISSYFEAKKERGIFSISTFSVHDKVGESVRETLNVIKKYRTEGVSQDELDQAKAYLRGVFPRVLETPESLAQNLLMLRYHNIGDDYLNDYLSTISDISKADVNRAIKKHLSPENINVLVFGPKKHVRTQLEAIGKVQMDDYRKFL